MLFSLYVFVFLYIGVGSWLKFVTFLEFLAFSSTFWRHALVALATSSLVVCSSVFDLNLFGDATSHFSFKFSPC